jgi:hypothetical protein
MYCPDTLHRLNQEAVDRHYEAIVCQAAKMANDERIDTLITCDFCDEPATHHIPVYNPADAFRGVEGACGEYRLCHRCYRRGDYLEDLFVCQGCGQLFITHHSWDVLYTEIDGDLYCQACALEKIEPVPLGDLINDLYEDEVPDWHRINGYPGHEQIWSGEFAESPDFPGHTSLRSVADSILKAAEEAGYGLDTLVVPLITHGFQFSVVLGVFLA